MSKESRDPETEIKRTRALAALNKEMEEAKHIFRLLPQGEGSGLDADMVDGLHADEIIAKAKPTVVGGGGGAGGGMEVHGNEYHEPDFSPEGHTHTESEITDLDHNAQKIKGKEVDATARADDRIIVYKITEDKHVYEDKPTGGGAPTTATYITKDDETVELPNSVQHQNIAEANKHTPKAHDINPDEGPHTGGLPFSKVEGVISDAQHGTKTTIPNAHHVKTGDNEVYGLILCDLIANRPAAGIADRFFWATDEHILYRDTGTSWVKAAVADHGDLDGIGPSDHHTKTVSLEIDHGSVMGLGDDDHSQYLNVARHDLTERHPLGTVVPHDALANLTERNHANLTNVTAYQHHAWQQRVILVKMIGHASKSGTGWAAISYSDVVFDPNWLTGTVKGRLCVVARMTGAGTGYARLYAQFQDWYMLSTQITVSGTSYAIYRSAEFTDWVNGLESYMLALWGASGVSIEVASAFLEIWVS